MNPLSDILPAAWRRRLYVLYGLVGLLLGAVQVTSADSTWLGDAVNVYAYLGVALGFTAASNVPRDPTLAERLGEPPID